MDTTEEEFVPEEEAEEGPALVKKLREKVAAAVKEKQEYLEGWQRTRADFANYKKEEAGMSQEREARTRAECIEELLPALDALWLSVQHDKNNDPVLQMLDKQFLDSLKRLGIERFGSEGETFDPHKHEALREVDVDEKEKDHTIISIERPGYSVGERVVRPAQVAVGSHKK